MASASVCREESIRQPHTWLGWALAGVVYAWLLWMTLRPNQIVAASLAPLTAPVAARGMLVRLLIDLGNVAVFIPLGAALALALSRRPARTRLALTTLAGAGLSLVIELAQSLIPTRVAALEDWLLNTVGVVLGALLFQSQLLRPFWFGHRERG